MFTITTPFLNLTCKDIHGWDRWLTTNPNTRTHRAAHTQHKPTPPHAHAHVRTRSCLICTCRGWLAPLVRLADALFYFWLTLCEDLRLRKGRWRPSLTFRRVFVPRWETRPRQVTKELPDACGGFQMLLSACMVVFHCHNIDIPNDYLAIAPNKQDV